MHKIIITSTPVSPRKWNARDSAQALRDYESMLPLWETQVLCAEILDTRFSSSMEEIMRAEDNAWYELINKVKADYPTRMRFTAATVNDL